MIKNESNIAQKLRNYQFELYKGESMNLKNLRFECKVCQIHFTPSEYRAKELMKKRGVINACRDCEEESSVS
tara:strand:- start:534 stop:749 length:216 start_codon:yes stop_codon:yes gene_type:complete